MGKSKKRKKTKKIKLSYFDAIFGNEGFHDNGIYLPTRTIYFGSATYCDDLGESGVPALLDAPHAELAQARCRIDELARQELAVGIDLVNAVALGAFDAPEAAVGFEG